MDKDHEEGGGFNRSIIAGRYVGEIAPIKISALRLQGKGMMAPSKQERARLAK
ncbi:MAG: hypothetical protein ABSE25_00745 [Syntrophorhabdales bacterium]